MRKLVILSISLLVFPPTAMGGIDVYNCMRLINNSSWVHPSWYLQPSTSIRSMYDSLGFTGVITDTSTHVYTPARALGMKIIFGLTGLDTKGGEIVYAQGGID